MDLIPGEATAVPDKQLQCLITFTAGKLYIIYFKDTFFFTFASNMKSFPVFVCKTEVPQLSHDFNCKDLLRVVK